MTKISIIIPCYNHGRYIDEAITSVKGYIYDNYEIIIINDGSTDEFTNLKLKQLKSEGYNVIFQENMGLGATRNNAIKLAKGEYILPLDADNKIKPEYIEKAIKILDEKGEYSVVYSDRQTFGMDEEIIKVGDYNIQSLLAGNYIDACAIFRKDVWEKTGGYDEHMPIQGLEDWDFWLTAAEQGFNFFYIPEALFYYRVSEKSMIKNLIGRPELLKLEEYVYSKRIPYLIDIYRKKIYGDIYLKNYENKHPFFTAYKHIRVGVKYFLSKIIYFIN